MARKLNTAAVGLSATLALAGGGLASAVPAAAATAPRAGTASPASASRASRPAAPFLAPAVAGGTLLWADKYRDGLGTGSDGIAVAASPSGSVVFVTGAVIRHVTSGLKFATETVAYDAATGALLWQARFNPGGTGTSEPSSITVSPDGTRVFITADTEPRASGPFSSLTIAYDAATGATLWSNTSATLAAGLAVAVSGDGSTVFVAGGQGGTGPNVMAISATTGTTLWTAGEGSGMVAVSLAPSPDGSAVFVTSRTATSPEVTSVARYDAATGAQVWAHAFSSGGNPVALAVSPDGSKVIVAGDAVTAGGVEEYLTAGYDAATGAQAWARSYENSLGGSEPIGLAVNGSSVFVTGTTGLFSHDEYATVAYDAATGSQVWVRLFKGVTGGAQARAIAASPDGSEVFVTGDRMVGSADVFGTVAYDSATGTTLWVADYGSTKTPPGSTPAAVSASSAAVFITGTGATGLMTTVAYTP